MTKFLKNRYTDKNNLKNKIKKNKNKKNKSSVSRNGLLKNPRQVKSRIRTYGRGFCCDEIITTCIFFFFFFINTTSYRFTPIGVASVICDKIIKVDQLRDTLLKLIMFIGTTVGGFLFYQLIVVQLIYFVIVRKSPWSYYVSLGPALATAFATASKWDTGAVKIWLTYWRIHNDSQTFFIFWNWGGSDRPSQSPKLVFKRKKRRKKLIKLTTFLSAPVIWISNFFFRPHSRVTSAQFGNRCDVWQLLWRIVFVRRRIRLKYYVFCGQNFGNLKFPPKLFEHNHTRV